MPRRDVDIAAAVVLAEDVQVADLRVRVDGDGRVAGHDDPQLADVDFRPDVRLARDRADAGQVELEVADAELVGRLQRRCRRRRVDPVADAVAEADVEPRERCDHGGRRQCGEDRRQHDETRRIRPARRSARLAQRMASPANRMRIQPAPAAGHTVACDRSTMIATAAIARPTSGQGRSRRSASTCSANDLSLPSSGITNAATR